MGHTPFPDHYFYLSHWPRKSICYNKIVFDAIRPIFSPHGNFEIYSMNADGFGQRRLTSQAGNNREPSWSLDGSKIALPQ